MVMIKLAEEIMKLSKKAKILLKQAEEDIKQGRVHSFGKVKKILSNG